MDIGPNFKLKWGEYSESNIHVDDIHRRTIVFYYKLDGVGPINNIPSTN